MENGRNDQLGNPLPTLNRKRFRAQIYKDNLDLPSVVGIDRARSVEHRDAVAGGETGARPHLAFKAARQRDGDAGWDLRPPAGGDRHRRIRRHRGHEIEPRRVGALIGRQRQTGAVRQPHDLDLHRFHFFSSIAAAIRWISAAATSFLDCGGQFSTPSLVTRWMVLLSPPMMPVSGDTSLARIQSQPLRASLALACSTTCWVSAAKPITSFGRLVLRCATVERMSGFSMSSSSGVPLPVFLIFSRLLWAVRQSATAAANTAISAGSAFSTAASMSRALSTFTMFTPGGSGIVTGPDTSVTCAPARAAASAMA